MLGDAMQNWMDLILARAFSSVSPIYEPALLQEEIYNYHHRHKAAGWPANAPSPPADPPALQLATTGCHKARMC